MTIKQNPARPWRALGIGVALMFGLLVVPAARVTSAPLSADDLTTYKSAFQAARKLQWRKARSLSAKAADPSLAKVIEWLYLQEPESGATFDQISDFIDHNPDWPLEVRLVRQAEATLADDAAPELTFDWFARHPPMNGEGRLKLAQALIASGRGDEAQRWLEEAWLTGSFSARRERDILRRHGPRLTPALHDRRLDKMLWAGSSGAARRALKRVGSDQAALGLARLTLMVRSWNVDNIVARVPAQLKQHPGLVYERVRWRRKKGLHESAEELLHTAPQTPAALVRPDKWWFERRYQARRALNAGRVGDAYELARGHGLMDEADWLAEGDLAAGRSVTERARISEAEWLAGWIALTRLNQPDIAYRHFVRVYAVVRYPVSIARAAYWAGRAARGQNTEPAAAEWFEIAARHGTTFYGQLAATEIGAPSTVPDVAATELSAAEKQAFEGRELARVIGALTELGEHRRTRNFALAIYAAAPETKDRLLLANYLRSVGRPDIAVQIARAAARDGELLWSEAYPTLDGAIEINGERPLIHALVRQESGFYVGAKSSAGALGLMQLMPYTALQVAKRMKLAYSKDRLTVDGAYNASIGSNYLGTMLRKYGGSYILALAAYNAGPSAVDRWLRNYGDPRAAEIDPVNWIETIPYRETRDYVQRVIEATPIYRQRLAGSAKTQPTLDADLSRASRPAEPLLWPQPKPAASG